MIDYQTLSIGAAGIVAGWVLCRFFIAKVPNEKTLALKAGIAALDRLAKLQSTAPAALADAAAAQAREAALLAAFKDAASKLQ